MPISPGWRARQQDRHLRHPAQPADPDGRLYPRGALLRGRQRAPPSGSVDPAQRRYRSHGQRAAAQRPDRRGAQAGAPGGGTQKRRRTRQGSDRTRDWPSSTSSMQALQADKPLRDVEITPEEEKLLSGFGFLTPQADAGRAQPVRGPGSPQLWNIAHARQRRCRLQGKLEMDIAQLPPEDAAIFMEEYGIEELSLNRMIRLSYDLLGLQSFFTVGEDEVRAWTVRRGRDRPRSRRRDPHRPAKGLHPRRGGRLCRPDRPGRHDRSQRQRQAAPGRQRIHRPGRRYRAYPL